MADQPESPIYRTARKYPSHFGKHQYSESAESSRSGWRQVALNDITVHVVYAKPPDGDPRANIAPPDVTHLGFVIVVGRVTLYFSGDPINIFAEHDSYIKPIADLAPNIGFLTNHPTEGEFPFYEGCVKMAQKIGLTHVVPTHRACFVKRDYDPEEWAAQFPTDGPKPLIIPRNSHIVYGG